MSVLVVSYDRRDELVRRLEEDIARKARDAGGGGRVDEEEDDDDDDEDVDEDEDPESRGEHITAFFNLFIFLKIT